MGGETTKQNLNHHNSGCRALSNPSGGRPIQHTAARIIYAKTLIVLEKFWIVDVS